MTLRARGPPSPRPPPILRRRREPLLADGPFSSPPGVVGRCSRTRSVRSRDGADGLLAIERPTESPKKMGPNLAPPAPSGAHIASSLSQAPVATPRWARLAVLGVAKKAAYR